MDEIDDEADDDSFQSSPDPEIRRNFLRSLPEAR
jgi:hypothetical protein